MPHGPRPDTRCVRRLRLDDALPHAGADPRPLWVPRTVSEPRAAQSRQGVRFVRQSTATSCPNISISTSLDDARRPITRIRPSTGGRSETAAAATQGDHARPPEIAITAGSSVGRVLEPHRADMRRFRTAGHLASWAGYARATTSRAGNAAPAEPARATPRVCQAS